MGIFDRFRKKSGHENRATHELVIKGSNLAKEGRLKEALECFDTAIKLNPRDAQAWFWRGIVLGGLSRLEEAFKCFDRAVELDPSLAKSIEDLLRKHGLIK